MATTDRVHFVSNERARQAPLELPPIAPSYHQLATPVRSAIVCARRFLLGQRREDGSWCGAQRGDASLPSQLVMLLAYIGRGDDELVDWAANAILRDQNADGGWSAAPGGPPELSISVQAYLVLKLARNKPNRPYMAAARQVIRGLGGADCADAATRRFLTLFDSGCSAGNVRELYIAPVAQWPPVGAELEHRDSAFSRFVMDAIIAGSIRDERFGQSVIIDDEREEARPSLAISPEIDTPIVREALRRSGLRFENPRLGAVEGARKNFDASVVELVAKLSSAAEDCDDGTESLLPPDIQMFGDRDELRELEAPEGEVLGSRAEVAVELLSRQNSDGGWSDGRECAGGSDPGVTGAVLEVLSLQKVTTEDSAGQRGIEFLRSSQRGDGSWESATGVRLINGTSFAVRGLIAAGATPDDSAVAAGVNWLVVHQHENGGWGEAAAHAGCEFVPAAASAMQTAWAVAALMAAGLAIDEATLLGIQFLLETQEDDGDWRDEQFTLCDPISAACYRNDLRTTATSLRVIADWAVVAAKEQVGETPACLKLAAT